MSLSVHADLQSSRWLARPMPYHNRAFLWVFNNCLGSLFKTRAVAGVSVEAKLISSEVGVRIYRPEGGTNGAGLIWIHSGGYLFGRADMNDLQCSHIAKTLGILVVSVEYRLAPKHPYPAAIDDCFGVWDWLQEHACELEVDPTRIAICGQSAGGGLAATLCQRIQDVGANLPVAQVLIYPMLDDFTACRPELDEVGHLCWNNRLNRVAWDWYLPCDPGAAEVPPYSVAARRPSLSGLPPAWIGVGDVDLFHAESLAYAKRLQAEDVDCQVQEVSGGFHAFDILAPNAPVSQEFQGSYIEFLRDQLMIAPENT